jgi:hypothetical protein
LLINSAEAAPDKAMQTRYYQILAGLGDLPGMTALANDPARHVRLLGVTGRDAAAITEIRTDLDLIALQDNPDLGTALALACHRDHLTDRNIGPGSQAEALAEIAGTLAAAGQYQHAAHLATQAGRTTRAITHPVSEARKFAEIAQALVSADQVHAARQIVATACASDNWTIVATSALIVDPSAWASLTQALENYSVLSPRREDPRATVTTGHVSNPSVIRP